MRLTQQPPHIPSQEGERYNPNFNPITEMLRQWSVQAPGEPEPEPTGEELWEQEMERLCSSQEPVRVLPYAMVDKRFIRWVPEHPAEHSGGGAVGVGRGCTCWMGGGNHQQWEDSLAQGAALPGQVGMLGDSGTPPITTPSQAAAGARRGEDLVLAAVASQAADCTTAPGGGSTAAGPGLWALGGGSLRDRG